MKVDLNLVSIEAEDLIITLKAWKVRKRVNFDDNSGDDDDNDNDGVGGQSPTMKGR